MSNAAIESCLYIPLDPISCLSHPMSNCCMHYSKYNSNSILSIAFPPPVLLHFLAVLSTTFSHQGLTALKCEQILGICLVTAIMREAVFSPRHIFCLNANGVQAREGEACQRQKQENFMAMVKREDRWCFVAIDIACECACVSEKDEVFPLINRLAKCLCISLFSSLSLLLSLSASLSLTHTQTCERRRIRYIQR